MSKLIPYRLDVFDAPGYVDRAALAALIQEQLAPEIHQGAVEQSIVLSMGRRLPDMTSNQTRMVILDALPVSGFLEADEAQKPLTKQAWKNKTIKAAELAVIVPVSQSAADDADYDVVEQVSPRLKEAFGRAIDAAILFGTGKPTFWPDGIVTQATTAGAVVEASTNLYDDLLASGGTISKVEDSGYEATGHVGAISLKSALRSLKDTTGRPIFLQSMQTAGNYTLDGAPIRFPRNGGFDVSKALLISGDFSQLVYSIRQDITVDIFTEGVVQDSEGNIVYNLMQNDMFAIRAVMRLGWEIPNPINGINSTATRFPFAVLKPKTTGVSEVAASNESGGSAAFDPYTQEQLNAMTIDQIKSAAAGMGYTITKTTKADIIAEFLSQQNAQG